MAYALGFPKDVTDRIYSMRDFRWEMVRDGGKTPSARCFNTTMTRDDWNNAGRHPVIVAFGFPGFSVVSDNFFFFQACQFLSHSLLFSQLSCMVFAGSPDRRTSQYRPKKAKKALQKQPIQLEQQQSVHAALAVGQVQLEGNYVVKTSSRSVLKGEMFFYAHAPSGVDRDAPGPAPSTERSPNAFPPLVHGTLPGCGREPPRTELAGNTLRGLLFGTFRWLGHGGG